MSKFRQRLSSLRHDERGATIIEYSLMIGLIAVSLIIFFNSIGNFAGDPLETISSRINDSVGTVFE
ncbi:Flp family type IVb pilin [Parapedomonas caeni]